MPKIKYVGPFDAVELRAIGAEAKRNHQIEVDDETFASLIEQTDWEDATSAPAAKPKKPRAKKSAAKKSASTVAESAAPVPVGEAAGETVALPAGTTIIPAENGDHS